MTVLKLTDFMAHYRAQGARCHYCGQFCNFKKELFTFFAQRLYCKGCSGDNSDILEIEEDLVQREKNLITLLTMKVGEDTLVN